jgi:hypothetical protein
MTIALFEPVASAPLSIETGRAMECGSLSLHDGRSQDPLRFSKRESALSQQARINHDGSSRNR